MNNLIKNKLFVISLIVIFLFSFTVCEKNPTKNEEEAPALPPVESMKMDLSFFTNPPAQNLAKTRARISVSWCHSSADRCSSIGFLKCAIRYLSYRFLG